MGTVFGMGIFSGIAFVFCFLFVEETNYHRRSKEQRSRSSRSRNDNSSSSPSPSRNLGEVEVEVSEEKETLGRNSATSPPRTGNQYLPPKTLPLRCRSLPPPQPSQEHGSPSSRLPQLPNYLLRRLQLGQCHRMARHIQCHRLASPRQSVLRLPSQHGWPIFCEWVDRSGYRIAVHGQIRGLVCDLQGEAQRGINGAGAQTVVIHGFGRAAIRFVDSLGMCLSRSIPFYCPLQIFRETS